MSHEIMLLDSEFEDRTGDLTFLYRGCVVVYSAVERVYYQEDASNDWPGTIYTFPTLHSVCNLIDQQIALREAQATGTIVLTAGEES